MGYNVLDSAADKCSISLLKELVEAGGKPEKSSALSFAIQSSDFKEERLEKVDYLLDNGAPINYRVREWCCRNFCGGPLGKNTGTPIHNAVAARSEEVVVLPLKRGADPTKEDWQGRTPLAMLRYADPPQLNTIKATLEQALKSWL